MAVFLPSPEKKKATRRGGLQDWWRRAESNRRPQALHSQDYMLSLVIWISPRARRPAGWRSASRFDGSARPSDQTAGEADVNDAAPPLSRRP